MQVSASHSPSPKSRRPWWSALYLILANTLLVVSLAELVARACIHTAETPASGERPASAKDVPYQLHPSFQTVYPAAEGIADGSTLAGWRIEPSVKALESDARRIWFLGGSTTASLYPTYVRRFLLGNEINTTAVVMGFDWHCSLHTLHKLWTYGDEVRPDLVVVLEGINDFYRGFTTPDVSLPVYRTDYSHYAGGLYPFWSRGTARADGRPVFYARPSDRYARFEAPEAGVTGLARDVWRGSALVAALRGTAQPPEVDASSMVQVHMSEAEILRSLPEFRRNLRNIAQTCQAKGWPVLLVTMPWTLKSQRTFLPPGNFFTNNGQHHLDDAGFAFGMKAYNDAVRALASEYRLPLLDLEKYIISPAYFTDEVHLTEEGLVYEGRLVGEHILDSKLIRAAK